MNELRNATPRLSPKQFRYLLAGACLATSLAAGIRPASACTCPAEPETSCLWVASSSLTYSNSATDIKDKLSFTAKGANGPDSFTDFGDPSASASACLCLYDNGALVQVADIPAAGTCDNGAPCWTGKPGKSWTFQDGTGANDGVTQLALTYKAADQAAGAKLKAAGEGVVDLALPLTGPVVLQLHENFELCFGAVMDSIVQDETTGKLKLKQKLASGADYPTCSDGVRNGYETGVDCGAPCLDCSPNCFDGEQNGSETGVDCGGDCTPCAPTCTDGEMNGMEAGVDCGGDCPACITCRDGIQNGLETGIDCGGTECPLCPLGEPKKMFVSGLNFAPLLMTDQAVLDLRCNELAHGTDPMDTSDYFAWTCTNEDNDPDSRFTKYSDPYVRFSDGVVVASGGWNELTGGAGIDNAVLKDESGAIPFLPYVWTGTRNDGTCGAGATAEPLNCAYWTTETSPAEGGIGNSTFTGTDLWNAWSTSGCSFGYYPIYCVEQ